MNIKNGEVDNHHGDRDNTLTFDDIKDAEPRLERFSSFIKNVFPETEEWGGIIESLLTEILRMKECLEVYGYGSIKGKLFIKRDS